jgi:nucleoside-triphosphatase THEP1
MITIFSGGKNAGKTTAILDHFRRTGTGDGLASIKVVEDDVLVGFDLMRLTSLQRMRLARVPENAPGSWVQLLQHGSYVFDTAAFDYAIAAVQEIIRSGISPVYLDEVGKLELGGSGFDRAMMLVVNSGVDAVLTVRDLNVEAVVRRYEITDYRVLDVGAD